MTTCKKRLILCKGACSKFTFPFSISAKGCTFQNIAGIKRDFTHLWKPLDTCIIEFRTVYVFFPEAACMLVPEMEFLM